MNQPEVERRWTSIRISEVSHTTDRQDRPQYKLVVHFEWHPHSNTWGDNLFVYKDQCPPVIEAGTHNVLVERSTLKKQSDNAGGGFHDGTQDWMYRWKIVEWESMLNIDNVGQSSAWGGNQAPVTPIPTPRVQETPQTPVSTPQTPSVPTQAPVQNWAANMDDRSRSIIRQVAFKAAVDTFSTIEDIASSTDTFESIILGTYVSEVTKEEVTEEEVDF